LIITVTTSNVWVLCACVVVQTQAICNCRIKTLAFIWFPYYFPNLSFVQLTAQGGLPENPGKNIVIDCCILVEQHFVAIVMIITGFFKENVKYPVWTWPAFSDSPEPIFSDSRDPIFSDSRDPTFNSIGSLKHLKKTWLKYHMYWKKSRKGSQVVQKYQRGHEPKKVEKHCIKIEGTALH